jgi:ribonuclease HI
MTIYVDGGARGNPGPAAIGFVVYDATRNEKYRFGSSIGVQTNNFAEYSALIEALTYLHSQNIDTKTTIYSDSELIVRQINGIYRVKDDKLIPLYKKALELMHGMHEVQVQHVRREENKTADRIVNRVLDNASFEA